MQLVGKKQPLVVPIPSVQTASSCQRHSASEGPPPGRVSVGLSLACVCLHPVKLSTAAVIVLLSASRVPGGSAAAGAGLGKLSGTVEQQLLNPADSMAAERREMEMLCTRIGTGIA